VTDNEQDAPKERDGGDLERLLAEAEAGDLLACADLAGRAASLARQVIDLRARVAELERQASEAITTSCKAIAAMDKALSSEQEMARIASNAIIELTKETARRVAAEAELARLSKER
jgi:hypothetical protein